MQAEHNKFFEYRNKKYLPDKHHEYSLKMTL